VGFCCQIFLVAKIPNLFKITFSSALHFKTNSPFNRKFKPQFNDLVYWQKLLFAKPQKCDLPFIEGGGSKKKKLFLDFEFVNAICKNFAGGRKGIKYEKWTKLGFTSI